MAFLSQRAVAAALIVVFGGTPSPALSAPAGGKTAPPGPVDRAKVLQIARRYVLAHRPWAKVGLYEASRVGTGWVVSVRPRGFHGSDGSVHLIILNKDGRVLHDWRSE